MILKKTSTKTRVSPATHKDLVARVGVHVRKMGAQSVLTSQVLAGCFGLHTTDLEVLDLIYLREQVSAGELADATGLTSGSVTALIDRLAEAGYVERHADPQDRRRIQVRIRHDAIAPIKAVYEPMQARMFKLWSGYSARDLEVIADFLSRSTELAVACAEDIRRDTSSPPGRRRSPRTSHRESGNTSFPKVAEELAQKGEAIGKTKKAGGKRSRARNRPVARQGSKHD